MNCYEKLQGGTVMLKILFYDAKSYDKDSFNRELANFPESVVKV